MFALSLNYSWMKNMAGSKNIKILMEVLMKEIKVHLQKAFKKLDGEGDYVKAFAYMDKSTQNAFKYLDELNEEKIALTEVMNLGNNNKAKAFQVEQSIKMTSKDFIYENKEALQQAKELKKSKENAKTPAQAVVETSLSNVCGRNFSLKLVTKRKYYDETDVLETRYGFEIIIAEEKIYSEVKAAEIENFSWVRKATDGRAFIDTTIEQMDFKPYIHKILEDGYADVPWEYRYARIGWKTLSDGKMYYVCDKGIVGQPNNEIRSEGGLRFEIALDNVGTQQNFQEFYDMQRISRNIDFSRTLMVYASLSVLTTIFEKAGFSVKFLVGVLGTTNTMKTSSVLVFTKIFNALETNSPEVTFMSTLGGIEEQTAKFQDSILFTDDFMPAESRNKQLDQNNKLELLCRLYGDRASKKRMSAYSKQNVEFPVRGCCIFTGELMTGVESSRTRILQLKLHRGEIDKGVLAYYQQNPLILPTYLYGFIEFVQENLKTVMETISERALNYRAGFQYSIARLNECQAIMFTMIDIMIWYWTDKGFISSYEKVLIEWRQSIQNIVEENQRLLTSHSLPEMVLSALLEKIYTEPQKLKVVDEIAAGQAGYVYEDNDFYYIRTNDLYIVVKDYCKRYDFPFCLQKNIMLTQLRESGVLETVKDKQGHIQSARKLQQGKGITQRFLYIKKKKINEILNQND